MSVSTVGGTSLFGVQAAQGHHRHLSMSQRVDKMESAISQAVKDGKLSDDQASKMTKLLEDIKKMVTDAKTSATPLSSDQLKKIGETIKTVGKQFYAALNPSQSTIPELPDAAQDLFSKIDANGNGSIDKSELVDFAKKLNSQSNAAGNGFTPASYNGQGSFTMMVRQQTTISFSA